MGRECGDGREGKRDDQGEEEEEEEEGKVWARMSNTASG